LAKDDLPRGGKMALAAKYLPDRRTCHPRRSRRGRVGYIFHYGSNHLPFHCIIIFIEKGDLLLTNTTPLASSTMRRTDMNISIFGTGNMAGGLASLFAGAGHRVTLAARDEDKARALAAELDHGIDVASFADAAASAEAVVLAVPYEAAGDVIDAAGGLAGKIVIDITNPLTADYSGLTIGHTTSAGEEMQKRAPAAKVVKAFNTVFASVLQNGGKAAAKPATVFVAGDDEGARAAVAALARSAGLVAVETGGLAASRYLEPVAGLNIALGYGLGHGTDIAPAWQGVA
jgi:predicted dinucleotide-binding enzyme